MQNVILIGISIFFGFVLIIALFIAQDEKKERRKIENELNEVKEHEQHAVEIITEANQTKEDARTGDHKRDFNFMADKLHDLANR